MSGFRHFSQKGGVIKFVAGGGAILCAWNVTYEKKKRNFALYELFI